MELQELAEEVAADVGASPEVVSVLIYAMTLARRETTAKIAGWDSGALLYGPPELWSAKVETFFHEVVEGVADDETRGKMLDSPVYNNLLVHVLKMACILEDSRMHEFKHRAREAFGLRGSKSPVSANSPPASEVEFARQQHQRRRRGGDDTRSVEQRMEDEGRGEGFFWLPSVARCIRVDCPCTVSWDCLPGHYCCKSCQDGHPCATPRHDLEEAALGPHRDKDARLFVRKWRDGADRTPRVLKGARSMRPPGAVPS